MKRPPFNTHEGRAELQQRLNAIPGIRISDETLGKRPSIPLEKLAGGSALPEFLAAMDWSFEQARAAGSHTAASQQPTV